MEQPRYRRFSEYLRSRFGAPLRKLSLDAGFSCPNRDGRLSHTGCIFCNPLGFTPPGLTPAAGLEQQLQQQIEKSRLRGHTLFMAYFQPYTNTAAPLPRLRETYAVIRGFPEIKALAIGTRPDCVNEEILGCIAEYATDYEVWLEYGLQSIHDSTLRWLNRGHDARAFFQAVELTRRHPALRICAHIILGLPGESLELEAQTAQVLACLKIEGVKLHPLYVVRDTPLAREYAQGRFSPQSLEDYAQHAALFLEKLWPQTVIQRLTADCPSEVLLSPAWILQKSTAVRAIESWLLRRNTWQGKYYSEASVSQ